MHEMSICEGIIQVLEEQAASQHYQRVKTVWLEIGPLAMVENDALRFCFDAVTRNSLAEGARLEIIELPGLAWCLECARSVTITKRYDACSECGSYQLQVTQGEELRIKELEVE
ncbi:MULTISPECIES: hydrogenase maturation nickel metallochaperone HypA [Amphritea]|uniref:Hydrogenase maturation factor HypA n=2 Tax=Amphritea TaxID=515417 RepID=A0A1H9FUN1_9GAMM|nr:MULTISPECIES: hydrogenase maturation nickel metallochaperone HypA [Amphritea]MBN0986015.1 hydrogenase maturation nickel metallochaperone HypA [Amphritea pacifica]MBN1006795.1 hydrogenase maturation nickel metallochaperone HypA [Amphritea pacifica]SEQ41587.1 hydrogenase nickel incorporation protein HypA/HybF [Amphritea atlantica]